MPFCSKCGTKFDEESRFCSKCGAIVGGNQPVSGNAQIVSNQETRKASLAEMDRMIDYFSRKQAQYDEYDNCIEQISYYSNPSTVIKLKDEFQYDNTVITLIIIAIVIMAIGFLPCVISLALMSGGITIGSALAFFIGSIFLAGGTILLVFNAKKRIQYNKNYRSYQNDLKARQVAEKERMLKQYQDRFDQLVRELDDYFHNYGYCAVAESYTNPKILMEIREPIYIGRADTIKESMNLLIQDAHNAEMEMHAAETAKQAKSAARGAKATAFFTAASFINSIRR